jgi:hypothetical protein
MDTFRLAGEAMLQSHEGSRQIASALWNGLSAFIRRVVKLTGNAVSATPGPHLLP